MSRIAVYRACARVQFATVLSYRGSLAISVCWLVLQVYLFRVVWTAVYGDRTAVHGVPLHTMIAYSTIALAQYPLLANWRMTELISMRVRGGQIAIDMLRPVSLIGQVFAGQVGIFAAMLPFTLAALPIALIVGHGDAPADLAAAAGFMAASLLAFLIASLINLLLGLTSFWTIENDGFLMIYQMVGQFLSGALVPLWIMPGALRAIASVLPFQAMTYTPLAVYFGQVRGLAVLQDLGIQVCWVMVLAILARIVWSRAVRRVVVQGG